MCRIFFNLGLSLNSINNIEDLFTDQLHYGFLVLYPILRLLFVATYPGSFYRPRSEWLNLVLSRKHEHENGHFHHAKYYHVYIVYSLALPWTTSLESHL